MSVQFKVPLFILASFILNILFVGIYYNLTLANTIAQNYSVNQTNLENSAYQLVQQIENEPDYRPLIDKAAQQYGYLIEVQTRNGEGLYTSGTEKGVNLHLSATVPFLQDGKILILRVTKPLSLSFASSLNFVNDLFVAEFFIISFTLMLLALLLYMNSTRPIVELQRNIRQYKLGIKPKRTGRRDEIGMLQNDFVELTEALDEEKEKQNRMIASISHDIKTPLTSVMGYAEQLQKGNLSGERFDKYIHTIYSKSQTIKDLVDEFDDYIGVRMQPQLKKITITAHSLCKHIEEDYRDDLQSMNIAFSVRCECPESPLSVDMAKMSRVFGNIIGNSLRYAASNPLQVEITCRKDGNLIRFMVSDNGAGVPQEDLAKILEPFFTTDPGRKVSGLGLSICKSIIEAHGGSIWAESGNPSGLSICFCLPSEKNT